MFEGVNPYVHTRKGHMSSYLLAPFRALQRQREDRRRRKAAAEAIERNILKRPEPKAQSTDRRATNRFEKALDGGPKTT